MKRFCMILIALGAVLPQSISAATRIDSILAFTGGRQVIAVWNRNNWCDDSYNPTKSEDPNTFYNYRKMMILNTSEPGGERYLDSSAGWKDCPFPTRKDGKYVIYGKSNGGLSDPSRGAYIIATDGKTPPRNLNVGAECDVLCTQYNPATDEEFFYVMGAGQKAIYRIPLKSDYTADLSRKTQVIFQSEFSNGSGEADYAFSVSADGTKAGAALPWPETRIVDIPSKNVYIRHAGMFGCNCNIAPDNSYRFFHFGDDHDLIHMWSANLVDSYTDIPTNKNQPGNTHNQANQWPRFTSNAQFMTVQYPLQEEKDFLYSMSAAQVKAANADEFGTWCLGKFGADFKSVSWVMLAGGDRRHIEADGGGIAWIAQNPTPTIDKSSTTRGAAAWEPAVSLNGSSLDVTFPSHQWGSVSLIDMSGREIAHASGMGRATCTIGSQPTGTCIARVTVGQVVSSMRIVVGR